jgi:polyisoprenoid-binding protein YceI
MRTLILPIALFVASCAAVLPAAPVAVAPTNVAGSPVPAVLPQASDTSLDATQAPAGAYRLDARHASVIWRIRHMGLSPFTARFDTISGTLNLDPAAIANSSVDITIAANSVSTAVLNRDGQRTFDQQIAREAFAAEANPDIRFVSRSITATGPTTGLITGDLTLHGATHPATLEARFEGGRVDPLRGGYVVAFTGRTIIDRTQWGAHLGNPIADQTIGDDVEILISAEFVKS